jgi:hypothetical protein
LEKGGGEDDMHINSLQHDGDCHFVMVCGKKRAMREVVQPPSPSNPQTQKKRERCDVVDGAVLPPGVRAVVLAVCVSFLR